MNGKHTLLKKKLFSLYALENHTKKVISTATFTSICKGENAYTTPEQYRMTAAEATSYLEALKRCGKVVQWGDNIYLHPRQLLALGHKSTGIPQLPTSLPSLAEDEKKISATVDKRTTDAFPLVQQRIRKTKEFWAFVALLSGTQMLVLAYLQFLVFGWDVMEPITFFVTTTTALCAYAYLLRYGEQHCYESVDNVLLPKLLSKDLGHVDTDQWARELRVLQELHTVLDTDSTAEEQQLVELLLEGDQDAQH